MTCSVVKAELESALGSRFGSAAFRHAQWERTNPETVSTGVAEIDAATGGLPRGALTEICGPACSGRMTLLVSILAAATGRQEICALLDINDTFEPVSAARAGVDLDRLLWIRCGGQAEHALKAVDWLLAGGGFGVVVFDLADVPPAVARRIPLASWFRLRRAVEHTPTALVAVEQEPQAKSCSSLILELRRERALWSGPGCYRLLEAATHRVTPRKPVRSAAATFEARAIG